jgi:hypothetical protein
MHSFTYKLLCKGTYKWNRALCFLLLLKRAHHFLQPSSTAKSWLRRLDVIYRDVLFAVAKIPWAGPLILCLTCELQIFYRTCIADQSALAPCRPHKPQPKRHSGIRVHASGECDDRVTGLSGNRLRSKWWDEERGKILAIMVESCVDAVLPCRFTAKVQSLPVGLVHYALRCERRIETILTGLECRMLVWKSTFLPALIVELDNVFEALHVGVSKIGKICLDVVVKIRLYIRVF